MEAPVFDGVSFVDGKEKGGDQAHAEVEYREEKMHDWLSGWTE